MKVLVCGGRDFDDYSLLAKTLNELHAAFIITKVIHGAAKGADRLADIWAFKQGIPTEAFSARWESEGKAAGPLRNQRMLDLGKPDLVVAFKGGRGTADMVRRAREAGIKVLEP